jgi:pilus assembly protein CpaB
MTAMRRRMYALLAAFVLAAFGAVVLIQYVQGADARARQDEALEQVYVVNGTVPAGTAAGSVSASLQDVPSRLVAAQAVHEGDLPALGNAVTSVDLSAGEQLLKTRFVDPAALSAAGGAVRVPDGFQEVSVTLDAQRAVNGQVAAGDKVGVYVTAPVLDPKTKETVAGATAVNDVLVTRVAQSAGTSETGQSASTVDVTLAVTSDQAAVLVAGQSQNAVWLSLQVRGPASTALTTTSSTGANK